MKVLDSKFRRHACVITNGCPENRIDGARMQECFKKNGWIVSNNLEDADIIIFNACALTQYNQERSIELINVIRGKKKPNAELIVCGCLPKINKHRLRDVYQGITFGSDEVDRLSDIFDYRLKAQDIHANYLMPLTTLRKDRWLLMSFREHGTLVTLAKLFTCRLWSPNVKVIHSCNPNTFCIKVSTGCSHSCAYCAVKLSRGKLKSKPIHAIVEEFEEGLEQDYHDFALIGTDVGGYGGDLGTDLTTLIKELIKRKGDYQIRLRNVHPTVLINKFNDFYEIFETGRVPYILCAVQSGNNRILSLMKRGYRIEGFKEAVHTLNEKFPQIAIRTQIMVGFPSETNDDFQDSVRLLDELSFDYVEVYMFEKRPGTKAALMKNQVPEKVARRRYHRLFMKSVFNERMRRKRKLAGHREKRVGR